MNEGTNIVDHLHSFVKIISQLFSINVQMEYEDKAMILLSSLPPSFEHLVTTLMYGKDMISWRMCRLLVCLINIINNK